MGMSNRWVITIFVLVQLQNAACASFETMPIGHRLYTYAANYTEALTAYNTDPATKEVISQVNVYGGYFARYQIAFSMNCSSTQGGQETLVTNNGVDSLAILQHVPNSKSKYVKCPSGVPPGAKAQVLLDPAFEYIIFSSTSKAGKETDLECDATAPGIVPAYLTFPMDQKATGAACKQKRGSPPPPLPIEYSYSVTQHPTANITQWAAVPGVDSLTVVLDGRMNGCEITKEFPGLPVNCDEFPDLRNASHAQLATLATQIAQAYCTYPQVSGLQVDLEPYAHEYQASLNTLMGLLSAALRGSEHGCKDQTHPAGRALSLFAFPEALQGTGLVEALGPNGYIIVSGYDLYTPDMGDKSMYNTPASYKAKLQQEVDSIHSICGAAGVPFSLAIPISASTHEYEKYTPGKYCGDICTPHTNPSTMVDYVTAALDIVDGNPEVFQLSNSTSLFRGLSLWLWTGPGSDAVEYPNHSGNLWTPGNPGPDVLKIMKQRLPVFPKTPPAPTPTPTPPAPPAPTCQDAPKPLHCPCTHKWDCISNYCTGTCANPPKST